MKSNLVLCLVLAAMPSFAQAPAQWQDGLIKHFEGAWKLEGPLLGNIAHHDVQADWVFNRQFLRITEKTSADAPAGERRYDAVWYLGYDSISDRYVLHLMDAYGARFSETLGYGVIDGNTIKFVFEYPDGPFHTTYRWSASDNSWQWLMEQKDKDGKWKQFADLKFQRAKSSQ
ncbi:MAG TPA: hypothetical protein VKS01_09185 [Bryobacteraceae bacterium]|nr:hypothetical protein [Bryobacteraceae bacterium]